MVVGGALLVGPVLAWTETHKFAENKSGEDLQPGQGMIRAAPTAAEAEAAFQGAREAYRSVPQGVPSHRVGDVEDVVTPTEVSVAGGSPHNVPLENIRLVVDVDNATLRQIVTDVVSQAAHYSGPWRVKWRLKPENLGLLDERVNLNAEAPLGEFFGFLSERVKNLTGTQLFVTVFAGSRVILLSDTYY